MNISTSTTVIAVLSTVALTSAYEAFVGDPPPDRLEASWSASGQPVDRSQITMLSKAPGQPQKSHTLARKVFLWTPSRSTLGVSNQSDPFAWRPSVRSTPPPPKRPARIVKAPPPRLAPAKPRPSTAARPARRPAINTQIAGRTSIDGVESIWLTVGNELVAARTGDSVAPEFRISAVTSESVNIMDQVAQSEQTIRWDSPNGIIEMHR